MLLWGLAQLQDSEFLTNQLAAIKAEGVLLFLQTRLLNHWGLLRTLADIFTLPHVNHELFGTIIDGSE